LGIFIFVKIRIENELNIPQTCAIVAKGTMIILECNIGASTGFIALHHMLNKTKEQ